MPIGVATMTETFENLNLKTAVSPRKARKTRK